MPYKIGAVDRALSLLEVLAEHPGLGVTEIAQLSGNTKSLVFRLIYTLEQRGYVIKDPAARTYTLGYRPLYLAAHAQEQLTLLHIAAPFLDELAERSEENVNLIVRDGAAEPGVLSLELLHPLHLIRLQPAKLTAPAVVADLRHADRTDRIGNGLPVNGGA